MTKRILLVAAGAATAVSAAIAAPASADPVCVSAQASGVFAVVHAGPVCLVDTPLPTTTHTESVNVGVETVTVTAATP